jgi:hypothetical protein
MATVRSAATGEYYDAPVRYPPIPPPVAGVGEYFEEGSVSGLGNDPSGIGHLGHSSIFGLAADAPAVVEDGTNKALLVGIVVGGIALRGVAGYFAGKAMGKKWKWWGVGSAVVFGAVGLGVLGAVAGSRE